MNKFIEYLETSKKVKVEMMEYLISEGTVKNIKELHAIDDILITYHIFPEGFSWNQMKSFLMIDLTKRVKKESLSETTSKQWVNRKISKMIDLGYAIKTEDSKDKRKIYIKWTQKMLDLYKNINKLFK